MNWQPIETSPKDGSYVFLRGGEAIWGDDVSPIVAGKWVDADGSAYKQWVIAWTEGAWYPVGYDNPTHWAAMEDCL